MGFFADTQKTATLFGKYITEFEKLYSANGISFGSPEDFFRLPPKLARDESFRDEFTALARSVQKREEERLPLTQMLSIVARATGGEGIEKTGEESTIPASLLVVFLAGLGGWSETDSAPEAKNTPTTNGAGTQSLSNPDDDQAAANLEQRLTAGPEEDIGILATTLFGGPAQVKEALGRLEMNTLQMKMHLDSIDSRMERIEPHLDELKSQTPAPSEPVQQPEPQQTVPAPSMKPWPRPEEEAPRPEWTASAPAMRPWPAEKEEDLMWKPTADARSAPARANWPIKEAEPVWRAPREASRPQSEASPRTRSLAEGAAPLRTSVVEEEDLPIRVPFDEYLYEEERSGWGRGVAGVFAVVLIALGVWGWVFYRHHGWHGYHDAVHTIAAEFAHTKAMLSRSALPASSPSTSPNAANQSTQAAAGTATLPPPIQQTAPPSAPNPSPATTSPQPTSAISQPAPEKNPTTAEDDAAASDATARPTESTHPHPAKSVPQPIVSVLAGSGVAPRDMADTKLPPGMHSSVPIFVDLSRLSPVADPMPEYPHDALSRGIEGDVVVEANITRSGDVESAAIVSGPAGLLKSSLDAVRRWRFRPYRMKGQPLKTRTYVRFRYRTEP